MKRLLPILLTAVLATTVGAAPAGAAFGVEDFDVRFEGPDGTPAVQAGAHPFAMSTSFGLSHIGEGVAAIADGKLRDVAISQVTGFAGSATAVPRCPAVAFLEDKCPPETAVGVESASIRSIGFFNTPGPVYNLEPPPGAAARIGWRVEAVPLVIDIGLAQSSPYNLVALTRNVNQTVSVFGNIVQLWGVPADERHDGLRGSCALHAEVVEGTRIVAPDEGPECSAAVSPTAFLTLPRACRGPLATSYEALAWNGETDAGSVLTHDAAGAPQGFIGCDGLDLSATISARPTTRAAQSATGLEFSLDVSNPGLENPKEGATAGSDIERAVVTLPEGMTVNPSQAEGLEVCSEAQLEREAPDSPPGAGCPQAAKIGSIEVDTPLLARTLRGALYVAEPYHNLADDSLIAVYVVIQDAGLGIVVKQPLKVEPDPVTGRLVSTAADMPQLPFSSFRLRFREGARAPLISPPGCGDFGTLAKLYPYAGGPPVETTSTFQIVSGPNEAPCPPGEAPFSPGFEAGTLNNAAGAYSPFLMRLTRGDGEQDLSNFSAVLPPGVVGSIAGLGRCPDTQIALARARTGPDGGRTERARPSCPADSIVGHTVAGAGVGSQLTYVPGTLYLAGPYNGAPLSVVSITPAVAGPFDAGVVVVREALDLNSRTGVVEVDGAASDPIPHLLKGIPLNVRDLRVNTDRPDFTLNATSCEEEQTLATLWGAGTVLDPRPPSPVAAGARYQAAGCRGLGFKPRLGIRLSGGTGRGAHPALKAVVRPRPGDANFSRAAVTLPRSAFLDQAHIRTICTRVQFAAGPGNGALCPKGARYGYARAWSPLLDAPAQGPVYLRSSDNKLPDLVVALRGPASAPFEVELSARIDSVKGGIRSTFTGIPDVPVSRFVLQMQGGKKGLIVNSRHLCHKPGRNRARANIRGQNGRLSRTRPRTVALTCAKRRKAKRASLSRARVARDGGRR